MNKNVETGHDKNVTYFQQLIAICVSYGASYNPARLDLKIAALDALQNQSRIALDKVIQQTTDFHIAENNRKDAFASFKHRATRILNALKATGASDATIEDAKSINRKIQGSSLTKKEVPDPNNPNLAANHISTSQQSYNSLIEHLAKLISLLMAEPSYTVTDPDISISDLTAYHTQLTSLNLSYMQSNAAIKDARIQRDKRLYAKDTGLYDTAQDVKSYIKSIFGGNSTQYHQVTGIKFTKKTTV